MRLLWFFLLVAVLAAAGIAGQRYGAPLAAAIGVPGTVLVALLWVRRSRRRDAGLHDESISTLVFPPESRLPR